MAINPMSNDMNIVQKLVIPGLDTDMDIIQKLDDEPNDVGGLTAQELKAKFDEAGNVIQRYINNTLLPNVSDTVAEEEVRSQNEATRQAQETTRESNETTRQAQESSRVEAEQGRVTAEEGRVAAEAQRASAEQERKTAESTRVSNETARQQNETGRQENEQQRQANETARQAAEAARDVFENYDAAKAYVPGNKVAYGGSSYLNQKACKGVAPTDTGYWLLIAKKGTDGQGAGDMLASTYDPQGKAQDVFAYTDDKIAAIPTPDVSEQIQEHNEASDAHSTLFEKKADLVDGKVPSSQLPEISSVKTYTATIGTTWTEDEDTGVKTQTVAINGVTASQTAKVDHAYTGSGTSDDYATFVEAENQYLTYITNGYAETVAGGIKFTIFGDANTVSIPIIVEVA